MYTLEGIGEDVAQYMKGCERLLSTLGRHTQFTVAEKDVISYYCHELKFLTFSHCGMSPRKR